MSLALIPCVCNVSAETPGHFAAGLRGIRRLGEETMDPLREQINKNYEAFVARLPELVATHRGKFALMRDGEIVSFFDTAADAHTAGGALYADGLFSVQEVVDTPADLGFFSHAVSRRTL